MNRHLCCIPLLLLSCLVAIGCQPSAKPSDPQVARQSLQTMLDLWKNGGSAAELKAGTPSIVCVDDDWEQGGKLVEYKVDDAPFDDGNNLHFKVKLSIKTKQGRDINKTITYIVGTHPVITIFRN